MFLCVCITFQGGRAAVMVCTGIEMIGLVYWGWSYTWPTVVSKITAECNRLVAYCMVRDMILPTSIQ